MVREGRIGAGVRFPSERRVAEALGCSRVTVTAALGVLRDRGLLISRTGAGSWTAIPSPAAGATGPWSTRAQGAEVDLDLSAALQVVAPDKLEVAVLAASSRLAAHLVQRSPDVQGLRDLRRLVADTYIARGLPTRPEQILITSGAQQALDLVLRAHLRPHDRLITDDPSYPGLVDLLRRDGHRPDPVRVDVDGGWRTGELLDVYRTSRSRLGIHVFDHHNPTGHLLPDEVRAELALVCLRLGTVLVVDETLAELGTVARTKPMAAHLPSALSVGSMSKDALERAADRLDPGRTACAAAPGRGACHLHAGDTPARPAHSSRAAPRLRRPPRTAAATPRPSALGPRGRPGSSPARLDSEPARRRGRALGHFAHRPLGPRSRRTSTARRAQARPRRRLHHLHPGRRTPASALRAAARRTAGSGPQARRPRRDLRRTGALKSAP